jgi:hypothetical protein
MICGSDGILAKPTNDNGKIANGSVGPRPRSGEAETSPEAEAEVGRGCDSSQGRG